jgi:hypothetical protein
VARQTSFRGLLLTAVAMLSVSVADPTWACDLCAVYTATGVSEKRFGLGIAQQFTRFATLQDGGDEVANPAHERIESSITQLYGLYRIWPWFGIQLNLPIITKSFRRLTADGIEKGDESGIGDMALLASVDPYSYIEGEWIMQLSGALAVKLPTGDSDRLGEELDGGHAHGDPTDNPWFPRGGRRADGGSAQHVPEDVPSGVHGHDLTLGSGSTDVVIGTQGFIGWRRFFGTAGVQYAIRTTGRFDYHYADDLLWFGGPGYFALLHDDYSLGLQALASGEAKGKDRLNGVRLDDTAITSVYIGPTLRGTWKDWLSVDLGVDLPLLQNNSALQLVPDYRIRGAVTWRF